MSVSESDELKHTCQECGGNVAYPAHASGSDVHCPHCGTKTTLGESYPNRNVVPASSTELPAALANQLPQIGTDSLKSHTFNPPAGDASNISTLQGVAIILAALVCAVGYGAWDALSGRKESPATIAANSSQQSSAPVGIHETATPATQTQTRQMPAATTDSAPTPTAAQAAAERTRVRNERIALFQKEAKELQELVQRYDDITDTVAEVWNDNLSTTGSRQLAVIRTRIVPLVRDAKLDVEKFKPQDPRIVKTHEDFLKLVAEEMSGWIEINNQAARGNWEEAKLAFDRRELTLKKNFRTTMATIEAWNAP